MHTLAGHFGSDLKLFTDQSSHCLAFTLASSSLTAFTDGPAGSNVGLRHTGASSPTEGEEDLGNGSSLGFTLGRLLALVNCFVPVAVSAPPVPLLALISLHPLF